jgi:RimJ/RimL family protein N-acetyltransferase
VTGAAVHIPTLETARLVLRPMAPGDFPAYARLMAGPRAAGIGGPFDTTVAWGLFCHDAACWALFGLGALMIERRGDGACVGQVGINQGPLFPEPELGWLLYDGHEGQGYASEAARALRDHAFDGHGLPTLVSYVGPDNLASARVARRIGGVPDPVAARQPGEGNEADLVFRHDPGARA